MNATNECRIYVASLSDYNAGILHGRWIDATQGVEAIRAEIAEMLRESKYPNVTVKHPETGADVPSAEEYAIHDYELGGLKIGEYESLETVAALAEAIEEHGAAFVAWHNNAPDYNTDADDFQEQYLGEWDSLADYAENYWNECGEFDADKLSGDNWWHPARYIDWEAMGRDLQLNGDVWTAEAEGGRIYVFSNQ